MSTRLEQLERLKEKGLYEKPNYIGLSSKVKDKQNQTISEKVGRKGIERERRQACYRESLKDEI